MALKLRPVNHAKGDKNRYCGPSAVSALTGMSTGEAARLIRSITGKDVVKGTSSFAILRALRMCGISNRRTYLGVPSSAPTLAEWLRKTHGRRSDIHLLVAGHHWLLVHGNRYVCGISKEIVPLDHPKVKRRARVTEVYELALVTARVTIPAEARKPPPTSSQKQAASTRVQARKLAERLGVKIERESGFSYPVYWVSHPDLTGDDDPCEGEHYCHDWHEVMQAVREYEKALEKRKAA